LASTRAVSNSACRSGRWQRRRPGCRQPAGPAGPLVPMVGGIGRRGSTTLLGHRAAGSDNRPFRQGPGGDRAISRSACPAEHSSAQSPRCPQDVIGDETMATGRLVIVRHYEPPPPQEEAALLHRVYSRLFDPATLERLTGPQAESTITVGDDGKGAYDASGTLRQG
jgi:hypothetical protein